MGPLTGLLMCHWRAQCGESLASTSAEQRPLWLTFKGKALEREFTWWHTVQMQKVLLAMHHHPGSYLRCLLPRQSML